MCRINAIYARQSVDRADSISIENQIGFCAYEARSEAYEVFADRGYSGKNTQRPEFQRMLRKIQEGKIHRVICYKLDRCSRSSLDFTTLMAYFQSYDVEFVSCTEKFDTASPMGRAMLSICVVFAQLERETIQQRVYDAYHARCRQGFYMGGRIPLGYRLTKHTISGKHTACYEPEQKEAEILAIYSQILPGLLLYYLFSLALLAVWVTGLVFFIQQRKKLKWQIAKKQLPAGCGGKAMCLNAGMIVFMILSLALTVLSLFI